MKKVITTLLFATLLTSCTVVPLRTQVDDSVKIQIKEGKLIAFDETRNAGRDYRTPKIDKEKQKNGIYICATSYAPSENCYAHLSAAISRYFTDSGIKVAKDRGTSDVVMYIGINFGYYYQDIVGSTNAQLMDEMESSLAKNNALSVNISEPPQELNPDTVTDQDNKNLLVRLGTVVATGLVASASGTQMANGVSMAAGEGRSCGGMCNVQAMFINIMEYDSKTGVKVTVDSLLPTKNDYFQRLRIYDGPVKANVAFPKLFDEAMKETVAEIMVNN